MPGKVRTYFWIATSLLGVGLAYWGSTRRAASTGGGIANDLQRDGRRPSIENSVSSKPIATNQILRLHRNEVLASVNNHQIRLEDLFPLDKTDPRREYQLQAENVRYLLKRAIDRELVFQIAEKRGLQLNDSQNQQLSAFVSERHQMEPGGIARLNSSEAGTEFELRDEKAFMLQTALMASLGNSPNVTEQQVSDYFQQHRSDFANEFDNPEPNQQQWLQIQFQIRQSLAAEVRSTYNQELAAFMSQAEADAQIVMFSGSDFGGAN